MGDATRNGHPQTRHHATDPLSGEVPGYGKGPGTVGSRPTGPRQRLAKEQPAALRAG
jgi:hypothetical protein